MARRRMIDPNFWQSEDISKLSIFARLVFIGMISNADDEGRGRANPNYIKSIVFPYDDIRIAEVDKALSEISHNTSVILYEQDGSKYYLFVNWKKWQRVDKPQKSCIPAPDVSIPELVENHSRISREPFRTKRSKEKLKEDNPPNPPLQGEDELPPVNKPAKTDPMSQYTFIVASLTPSENVREAMLGWIDMRIKKGRAHKPTEKAIRQAYEKVKGWNYSEDQAVKCFEQSTLSNWNGIFPLKAGD